METGEPNVDLANEVILLILFFFLSFSLSHFSIFFHVKNGITPLFIAAQNGHEQTVQVLLEKGKPNVDLPDEVILLIVFFFFFFFFFFLFFFFTFSFFYFNVKRGITPLFIAAQNGHEQVVQLLLEKGKPNVDLAIKVILLIVSFSFSFSFFFFFFFFHFLIFLFFLM